MDTNSKIKEALLKKSQGDIAVSESIFLEILDTSPQQYETLINLDLLFVLSYNHYIYIIAKSIITS